MCGCLLELGKTAIHSYFTLRFPAYGLHTNYVLLYVSGPQVLVQGYFRRRWLSWFDVGTCPMLDRRCPPASMDVWTISYIRFFNVSMVQVLMVLDSNV